MEHIRQFFSVSVLMDGFVILLFCTPHPPQVKQTIAEIHPYVPREPILFHPFWELFEFPVELILKW